MPEKPDSPTTQRPVRVFCIACAAILLLVLIAVAVAWIALPSGPTS